MGYEIAISPMFIRALYKKLILAGYSPKEAGNTIAKLMGLVASEKGWKIKELMHLLFTEHMDKITPP